MKNKPNINLKKVFINSVFPILSGILLVAGIIYAWQEPTATPPENNVAAPVNVGAETQYKEGALGIGGLLRAYSNAIFDGNVGIGTESPDVKLDIVGGTAQADDFCLQDNSKCLSTIGSGGGQVGAGNCICKLALTRQTCGNGWDVSLYQNCGSGWERTLFLNFASNDFPNCSQQTYPTFFRCDRNVSNLDQSLLFDGNHNSNNCTSAGGEVVTVEGSVKICRFNASACPSGWTKYNNWSTTEAKTCTGTADCPERLPNYPFSCTTGSHDWGNTATESCYYYNYHLVTYCTEYSCSPDGYSCSCVNWSSECQPSYPRQICTGNVTKVGCY